MQYNAKDFNKVQKPKTYINKKIITSYRFTLHVGKSKNSTKII